MLAADRRQPVALVRLGVLLAADPEEAEVEQAHRAGQRALARHPLSADVAADGAPQARQPAGELAHRLVLARRPALLPAVVVAVLLAPGFVEPGGLDVADRIGADPDLLPGGRDRQLADPLQRLLVVDPPPFASS